MPDSTRAHARPTCPECGAAVPAGAPGGKCPRCLLGAAMASEETVTHRPRSGEAVPTGSGSGSGSGSALPALGFEAYRQAARELELVDAEDLDRFATGAGGDVERLKQILVRSGRLTAYQAAAVSQGKAKGLLIGSYLVLDRLGVGGMGVVFKARHRPSGRVVALKILPPSFARERAAVQRFRREFEVASRLSHPNVVAAIEASEDRGVHFLTMEYIEGTNLDRLVRDGGPLPLKLALHAVIQVARGLEAAHAQGVIHRDIKPGNVMIDGAGLVRVLDLGLARVIETGITMGLSADGSLTRTGSFMGTVDFLAPEQANDAKSADHRADLYSLGCTLYFLLTGWPPFPGETVLKRLMAHQEGPAPSLRAARPEVPEGLEAVYQRLMAKKVGERPRTAAEAILALEACRATSREAGDASADFKTFARTAMKQAAPRGRDRSADASIFARPDGSSGVSFDPDLRFEDLVMDLRDEAKPEPLAEDRLPPRPPRPVSPQAVRRRRQAGFGVGTLVVVSSLVGAVVWWATRPDAGAVARTDPADTTRPVRDTATRADPEDMARFVPLFNGRDLTGWKTFPDQPGGWRVEDGILIGEGDARSHLYTVRDDYTDVTVRVEARINGGGGNSGVIARSTFGPASSSPAGGFPFGYEAQIDGTEGDGVLTGSLYFGAGKPLVIVSEPLVPPGQWFEMELTVIDDHVTILVDGHVTADYTVSEPERRAPSGHIALQLHNAKTKVEFRRIEVEEIRKAPSLAEAMAAAPGPETVVTTTPAPTPAPAPAPVPVPVPVPAGPRLGRVIVSDDHSDPNSGWPRRTQVIVKNARPLRSDYEDGAYFIDVPETWSGAEAWDISGPLKEAYQVEVVGKVQGVGNSAGAWGIIITGDKGRGFQVGIDRGATIEVRPAFWGAETFPNDPRYLAPLAHRAIKAGKEWNTITLRVRRREMEVLVNGEAVCETIKVPWDILPAKPEIAIFKPDLNTRIRADYDSVEVRELLPEG